MQKTLVYNILSNKARFIRSEIRLRAKRARLKETPKQTQLIVDFKPQLIHYYLWSIQKSIWKSCKWTGRLRKICAWLQEMVLEWIRKDLVMWNRLRWLKSSCELKVMSALSRVIIGSLYLFRCELCGWLVWWVDLLGNL